MPLPAHEAAGQQLRRILKNLTINPPQGKTNSPMAEYLSGRTYIFEPNYETLRSLCFNFDNDTGRLSYQLLGGGKRRGKHPLTFGYGTWQEGEAALGAAIPQCVAASAVWTDDVTLSLTLCQYETPFIITITCRFEGDRLFYDSKVNVSFGPLDRPQIIGIAKAHTYSQQIE
jgi:hypothetical protein